MSRAELSFQPVLVNKAGRELAIASKGRCRVSDDVLSVIGNWRAAHSFPLNTMKLWLLNRAKKYDEKALVAQRLKRMSSIANKLNDKPNMKLTQMQDIAGCRAIVRSVSDVYSIAHSYQRSDLRHELLHIRDYVARPKASGYRGIHLIYRYKSDRKTTYNGLKVEIQLRSLPQHAWATAVETVGVFTHQALKSSQGSTDWLRFFSLMSSALARRERTFPVPGVPDDPHILREELRELAHSLDVEKHLQMYAEAVRVPEKVAVKNAHYFLLSLDPVRKKMTVTGFQKNEIALAETAYLALEKKAMNREGRTDSVLVSVETFSMLKRAYPNYFLDTHRFIEAVAREIRPTSRRDNPAQRILAFPYFGRVVYPTQSNVVRSVRTGRYV